MNTDQISEQHLQRKALVYIRQSSLQQVKNNRESTRRQYALADRAREYGFKEVEIIDEDLGVSGSGQRERPGFQRLIAAVCCGEVGAVFALEASRLARNNRDWHHLLELCMMTGSIVVDDDGIYDPRVLNDRLLLGLKGTMSEFELGILRQRAQEAYRQKIIRGEVLTRVPVGYVREGKTGIVMTPDLRVQEALRGLFALFERFGSLRQALLWYHQEKVCFPAKRDGDDREIEWQLPNYQQLLRLIKNPVFAGAFAYGRTCARSQVVDGRAQKTEGHKVDMDKWQVLIKDHHSGYITWDQYMNNQQLLKANRTKSHAVSASAARNGRALLAGLLRCGKCGHKLHVQYRGKDGRAPRYNCLYGTREQGKAPCMLIGGGRVDDMVVEQVIKACQPLAMTASLQAFENDQDQSSRKMKALEMTLEHARYEAERTRKQYDAVDPENRLVSAELEKRWNEALLRATEAERRLDAENGARASLTPQQRQRLMELGSNLEHVWNDPHAPIELKKRIIRSVIKEIMVNTDDEKRLIELKIHWVGGVHTGCTIRKNKTGHNNRATEKNVVEIVRVYAQAWSDAYIASLLNRLGLTTGPGNSWNENRVRNLRVYNKIPAYSKSVERTWVTRDEAAKQLQVSACVIRTMVSNGLLPARQLMERSPWLIEREDLSLPNVINYAIARRAGKIAPSEDSSQTVIPYL